MIDDYSFGKMVINNVKYNKDLIILPDSIKYNWWRKESHNLTINDIRDVLESYTPDEFVVGTGKFGLMKIDRDLQNYLKEKKINLHAMPTAKAGKVFNQLYKDGSKVIGAFHLTC